MYYSYYDSKYTYIYIHKIILKPPNASLVYFWNFILFMLVDTDFPI